MVTTTFNFILLGFLLSWTSSSFANVVVERIVIVARHGDRAPLQHFPWDGSNWKQGYGHLTNVRTP